MTTQRDFGDRTNRKHARLKYTIDDRGLDWFVGEVTRRQGFALQPARPFEFTSTGDRFGWVEGHDGRWHLTLRIEAGRVADTAAGRGSRGCARSREVHRGDFRLTPNQNLIIANVEPSARAVHRRAGGALRAGSRTRARRRCGATRWPAWRCRPAALAMAEAERYLPGFSSKVEQRLAAHGLRRRADRCCASRAARTVARGRTSPRSR